MYVTNPPLHPLNYRQPCLGPTERGLVERAPAIKEQGDSAFESYPALTGLVHQPGRKRPQPAPYFPTRLLLGVDECFVNLTITYFM